MLLLVPRACAVGALAGALPLGLAVVLGQGGSTPSAFPSFDHYLIDNIGSQLGQTALADVDNDGDLDWISGQADRTGADIWWWEYQAPDRWVRHLVGKGHTDVGGAAHDVNRDGWVDILSGSRLLLNPGKPRELPFAGHDVGTIYSHDTEFADINGDGRMDALANSDKAGLFWYEIPADPRQRWTLHLIASSNTHEVHGGVSPRAVGDIDGDGDRDVVTAQAWYENVGGAGLEWRPHRNLDLGERHQYGVAVRTWVGDMDGDGDPDVVQSEADNPDGRVAWFENDGRGNWTRHIIKDKGDRQDFHALAVADFDRDGDLDVFSGGGPLSAKGHQTSYIWENTAGAKGHPLATSWIAHVIVRKPVHEVEAADVDADGDIDLVAKPWTEGNEHFYLRNLAVEKGKGRP
jgi:FG-GAP-like repeat